MSYRHWTLAPYVKVYLLDGKTCVEKQRTRTTRRTLDPLIQQILIFKETYRDRVLQVNTPICCYTSVRNHSSRSRSACGVITASWTEKCLWVSAKWISKKWTSIPRNKTSIGTSYFRPIPWWITTRFHADHRLIVEVQVPFTRLNLHCKRLPGRFLSPRRTERKRRLAFGLDRPSFD